MSADTREPDLRSELEREADGARARLLDTIDRLDQRRHDALDWKLQARRHSGQLAIVGCAIAATVGFPVAIAVYRASTRSGRLREERIRALTRFWKHPERVAAKRKRGAGFFTHALLLSAATVAVAVVGRNKLAARPARFAPAAPIEPIGI